MSKAVSRAAGAMIGLALVATVMHIFELAVLSNDVIYLIAAVQVFVAVVVGVFFNKPDRRVWLTLLLLVVALIVAQIFDNRDSNTVFAQALSET
ncbi:MAG: hypothetical protein EB028_04160, partial [Actinobacteria bacterium]|nr:hypothetical protein [Actinomycetota bacterium]